MTKINIWTKLARAKKIILSAIEIQRFTLTTTCIGIIISIDRHACVGVFQGMFEYHFQFNGIG